MKKKLIIFVMFIFGIFVNCFANETENKKTPMIYNFPVFGGSLNMMTMEQSNELFSSTYQLGSRLYLDNLAVKNTSNLNGIAIFIPYMLFDSFILEPLTHEEAHRTILTNKGIGSVSQPFLQPIVINEFFLGGVAYVKGVSDNTLINLRDTDLPSFIRLHTAGIESDYMLSKKAYSSLALNLDSKSDYKLKINRGPQKGTEWNLDYNFMEYITRCTNTWIYLYGGLSESAVKLEEESDELERDIVGDDVYGTIHHLFQPNAKYQRYIDYVELTEEERVFAKRVGWKSFLNLPIISPLWFGKYFFTIGDNHTLSFNTGYALAPFGDFMEENIYYSYLGFNTPLRFSFYARQYENRSHWFPAFGLQLIQYAPLDWLVINAETHFWMEPEKLDFNTSKSEPGGAVELELMFIPHFENANVLGDLGYSLGFMYKTKGFLPEIESHDSMWRVKCGLVLRK